MYGIRPPSGPGGLAVGGGTLAVTGAPPVMWLLALAVALMVTGALAYRARRLYHDSTLNLEIPGAASLARVVGELGRKRA